MIECLWTGAGILLCLILVLPVTVYLSVRMGTFGYLRAQQQFKKYQEEEHGE